MALRPYATRPVRFSLQVIADLFVLTWAGAWIWIAVQVYHFVNTVAAVGFKLRDGAHGIASNLHDAGSGVGRVPLVGGSLSTPLTSAGGAAQDVAGAGQQFGDVSTNAALPIAVGLAVLAILPLALPWLALRWRYARAAGTTADMGRTSGGTRLLALRAMATQPTRRLIAIDPDPIAAWSREDPDVTIALANLELRRLGLPRRRAIGATAASAAGRGDGHDR